MNRPALAVFLLALLAFQAPTGFAQTAPSAPSSPVATPTPPADVPQVSIAIGTFACKTNGCTYELGSGTADGLATALLDTGKFALYERENMSQLTEENLLSSSTPNDGFHGADVLIFGSITKYEDSASNGFCFLALCLGSSSSTVGADLRIVDARNRRVIAGTHVEGTSSSNSTGINFLGGSFRNSTSKGIQTALGDMIKKAVDQLILKIPTTYYRSQSAALPPAVSPVQPAPTTLPNAAPTPTPAQAAPPSFGWVNQFFFLDEATRQKACAEGFGSAAAGASATVPGHAEMTSTEGKIVVDTSYNSIFLACQSLGLKAQAQPQSVPQLDFVIHHIVNGFVSDNLKALALLFIGSSGNVLGRLDIFSGDNVNGHCGNRLDCPVPLTPNTLDNSTRSAISQADSIQFLVNFGKGIETLTFSKARFPDLK